MASSGGRTLHITNGGSLVFHESNNTGDFTASIVTDDLTANRTIRIADSDGILQGLLPGQGWPTSKGGTGLTVVPDNNLVVGTGTNTMELISGPTANNQVLTWDATAGTMRWVVWDFNGMEQTVAQNFLSDPTKPGLFSYKLGSTLFFKNLEAGTSVVFNNLSDRVNIGIDQSTLSLAPSQINATVPVAKGGTGRTSYTAKALLYSNAGTAVDQVAVPTVTNQVLTWDNTALAYKWQIPTYQGSFGGPITYPENQDYDLCLDWNNKSKFTSVKVRSAGGNCQITFKINGTAFTPVLTVGSSVATFSIASVQINPGDILTASVASVVTTTSLSFALIYNTDSN